jgi:hypothetical protein
MATTPPTAITYVYLKPELNQPFYRTLLPIVLLIGIIISAYHIGQRSFKSNRCDGEMAPFMSMLYGGWTNRDYVNNCIKTTQGFTTMELANGESKFPSFTNILQRFSTNFSLAMNQLKR